MFQRIFPCARVTLLLLLIAVASLAMTLPLCAGGIGKPVREGVGNIFTSDAALTLAPLIGLVLLALVASWIVPDENSKRDS